MVNHAKPFLETRHASSLVSLKRTVQTWNTSPASGPKDIMASKLLISSAHEIHILHLSKPQNAVEPACYKSTPLRTSGTPLSTIWIRRWSEENSSSAGTSSCTRACRKQRGHTPTIVHALNRRYLDTMLDHEPAIKHSRKK